MLLHVLVVVYVLAHAMVMGMMVPRGKGRDGKHHQQQDSDKYLLHGRILAEIRLPLVEP